MNGLMLRRRALMAAQMKPQFLEYIQSTGTQCIDTGYIPTENCGFYIKYRDDVVGNSNYVIGSRASTTDTIYEGVVGGAVNQKIIVMQQTLVTVDNYRVAGNTYEISATYDSNLTGVSSFECLNTSDSFTGTQESLTSGATANLFIFSLMKDAQFHTGMTLYSCRLWSNGILIRDFIPCRLGDSIGLYDLVNEKFYGNAGTGKFIAGPKIDYQFLEYVESTGTQYIDTEYKPNNTTTYDLSGLFSQAAATARMGARDSQNVNECTINSISGNQLRISYGSQQYLATSGNYITNALLDGYNRKAIFSYQNGTKSTFDMNSITFSTSYNCLIFAYSSGNSITYATDMHVTSCKIYDNNILVRDFVPCKLGSEVGLYDKITNKFFINRGTGSLVAGPEVGYQFVEYLQSSGTQYIDTRLHANQDYSINLNFQCIDASVGNMFFGARDSSTGIYDKSFIGGVANSGLFYGQFGDSGTNLDTVLADTNKHSYIMSKNGWYLDGTKYRTFEQSSFTGAYPILIFAGYNGQTILYSYCKIFDLEISLGTHTHKYVPCYRKLDHEPGLYDLVTGQFFTNQGTGSFIVGPELDYQFVEYIESTGEQYINTEISLSENLIVTADYEFSESTRVWRRLFGYGTIDAENTYSYCYNTIPAIRPRVATGNHSETTLNSYNPGRYTVTIATTGSIKVTGTNYSETSTINPWNTGTGSYPIFLFNFGGTTLIDYGIVKLYSFTISNSVTNKQILHLIPCYRKSTGTVGMYDLVTKRFFINSGTGKFIAGPEI